MIHVINYYRDPDLREQAVYVGRANKKLGLEGSPLANPFKLKPYGPYERGETIALYAEWLEEQIRNRNPSIIAELNRLYKLARAGDLYLMCFCAPKACHSDVLRRVLEEKLNLTKESS